MLRSAIAAALLISTPVLAQSAAPGDMIPAMQAPLDGMVTAWNTGDGPAWGRQFWPDADSVNIYGHTLHGGEAMGARHGVVFAGRLKGSKMKMEVLNTRAMGDVAVVDTIQDVTPGPASPTGHALQVHVTFVLQRRDGTWKVAHVQNTNIVAPPAD